jgi:hypothetical protein
MTVDARQWKRMPVIAASVSISQTVDDQSELQ